MMKKCSCILKEPGRTHPGSVWARPAHSSGSYNCLSLITVCVCVNFLHAKTGLQTALKTHVLALCEWVDGGEWLTMVGGWPVDGLPVNGCWMAYWWFTSWLTGRWLTDGYWWLTGPSLPVRLLLIWRTLRPIHTGGQIKMWNDRLCLNTKRTLVIG